MEITRKLSFATVLFIQHGRLLLAYAVIGYFTLYQLPRWIYNLYFHPLAGTPGPASWAMSRLPAEISNIRGSILKDIAALHEEYGEVVRIGPDAVCFNNPAAWADIYTQKPGKPIFPKDPLRHTRELWINGAPDIFTADDTDHPRLRRLLSPGFSPKAIREQEPLIEANIALLIKRLREQISPESTGCVDMNEWINWTTFDLIGDLAFGESFGCLRNGGYHPWVAMICGSVKAVSILGSIKQWPWLDTVWQLIIGAFWTRVMRQFHSLVIEKVNRRISKNPNRSDILKFILDLEGSTKGMSKDELYSNAALLVMAGTETSAATLTGTLYHLARNPHVLVPLQMKIRNSFASEEDITFKGVSEIEDLLAVLHESMRMYPSVAVTNPRKVPKGGEFVAGKFLPENTTVGIFQWVVYNSPTNFRDPTKFDPSRWQGNPVYKNDRREIFKPFTVGPKSCIGKQLAYVEMQLILAKILWAFDMELVDKTDLWTDQKVHWSWVRVPLMMRLTQNASQER